MVGNVLFVRVHFDVVAVLWKNVEENVTQVAHIINFLSAHGLK